MSTVVWVHHAYVNCHKWLVWYLHDWQLVCQLWRSLAGKWEFLKEASNSTLIWFITWSQFSWSSYTLLHYIVIHINSYCSTYICFLLQELVGLETMALQHSAKIWVWEFKENIKCICFFLKVFIVTIIYNIQVTGISHLNFLTVR